MKFQLLKCELDIYNEGEMFVLSEEEEEELLFLVIDETMIIYEWKFLYLVDILVNFRFSDLNLVSFMVLWYFFELFLDLFLFDDFEKKYFGLKILIWLEGKFVFDRVNSEIFEFFEQFIDFKFIKVSLIWDISRIYEIFFEFIIRKYRRDIKEKKIQLLSLEDGIEVIGKEIEELLIYEFIVEVFDCFRKVIQYLIFISYIKKYL